MTEPGAPASTPQGRLSPPKARGLTLLSVLAVALSPFPTFGLGIALGVILIVAAIVLTRKGYRARGPLAAGIVAVVVGSISAGACGWILRTAEVTGGDELRQHHVEDKFDRAFESSEQPPDGKGKDDAGVPLDAHSPPGPAGPSQERR